jgi:hypothetical protein
VISIDKDVAQELANFKGDTLFLMHLNAVPDDALGYLKSNPNILLPEKYRN